jgi:heme A synthase
MRSSATATRGYRSVTLWLAGAGLLLVSLGAAVVATDAEEACGRQWPLCNGSAVGGDGLAVLQVVHRTFGYAVFGLAVALFALTLRRRGPVLAGIAPALLAVAQLGFGVGIVLTHDETVLHDTFRVLHVAGSGAVWASIVSVFAVALLPPGAVAPVTDLEPTAPPSTLMTTAR